MIRRIDQGMAAAAAAMLPENIDATLRTRYRQLPIMVRTSGLAATYAYLVSRADKDSPLGKAYIELATGLRKHLAAGRLPGARSAGSNVALLDVLAQVSPADYARASAEVELLAGWVSRLAEARWQAAS